MQNDALQGWGPHRGESMVWKACGVGLPRISCTPGDRNCVEVGDAAKLGRDVMVTLLKQKESYVGCCWDSPWSRTNSESPWTLGECTEPA